MDKVEISFDQGDCPDDDVALSGCSPMILMAKISNRELHRVIIASGSPRNTIFTGTLAAMGVPRSEVKPASQSTVRLGVTRVASIGQITFLVTFGTPENARTEDLVFEVVDSRIGHDALRGYADDDSQSQATYDAILGCPGHAKFRMSLHLGYRSVKMPGPNGVITLTQPKFRRPQPAE